MVPELDQLYQGFSYLSCVIEYKNREETTPKISIFKTLEYRQLIKKLLIDGIIVAYESCET